MLKDAQSGETREIHPAGVFIFIGMVPNTAFLKDAVDLDKWGYIKTASTLETCMPGVFAAGDAQLGSTKQVAAAVGKGATAALMVRHYLETHKSR